MPEQAAVHAHAPAGAWTAFRGGRESPGIHSQLFCLPPREAPERGSGGPPPVPAWGGFRASFLIFS